MWDIPFIDMHFLQMWVKFEIYNIGNKGENSKNIAMLFKWENFWWNLEYQSTWNKSSSEAKREVLSNLNYESLT